MGKMMFGAEETLTCLVDVPLKGAEGEALCLANKITKQFFIAGIYLRDDGYVLKIRDKEAYYPLPNGPELSRFQADEMLPSPLPGYSIPWIEYAFGYSLWLIVAVTVIASGLKSILQRRRKRREALEPVTSGPPAMATQGDEYIASQASQLLEPNERVEHQAYGTNLVDGSIVAAARAKGYFAVLTDRRLILIETRVGAFSPIYENRGVEIIDRRAIVSVTEEDSVVTFILDGGHALHLRIPRKENHFSNQRAFLRDVPRLIGPSRAAAA